MQDVQISETHIEEALVNTLRSQFGIYGTNAGIAEAPCLFFFTAARLKKAYKGNFRLNLYCYSTLR